MIPMDAPTEDQQGNRLLKFQWGMAELRKDLANWSDHYFVTVTLNPEEQGKIWMVFQKEEDGCQD
jgi:hypothetical protein